MYCNADGKSLLGEPLAERKAALGRYIKEGERVAIAAYTATRDVKEMERFFAEVIGQGRRGS